MSVRWQRLREHWEEYVAALMGCLWLAVFPLWQGGSYSHITKDKLTGMHILCIVMVLLGWEMVVFLLIQHQRKKLRWHPAQLLAAGYFLWVALSAWQGAMAGQLNRNGDPAVWLGSGRHEGLQTQLLYGLIFFSMSLVRPRLKVVLRAAAVTLILFFGVTLMQYADLNPLGLFPGGMSTYTNYEFQGTIGNIDMVSGYLCLAVPLMLGGFVLCRRADPLLLIAGLCGVMDQMMIEVQSGVIALALGLGLMGILLLVKPGYRWRIMIVYGGVLMLLSARLMLGLPWLDGTEQVQFPHEPSLLKCLPALLGALCWGTAALLRSRPGRAMPGKYAALLVLAVILLGAVGLYSLPLTESAGGLWEIQQVMRGNLQDSFGSYRLGVWRYTLDFAREHPLFGTGPDTFLYAMKHYLAVNFFSLPETFDNPHNEYLAILSNNGLPALLLYLTLMGTLVISCIRTRRRETKILAGAVILFMVQGFFSFSICLVTPMFWAVCGMACAFSAPERSVPTVQSERKH